MRYGDKKKVYKLENRYANSLACPLKKLGKKKEKKTY